MKKKSVISKLIYLLLFFSFPTIETFGFNVGTNTTWDVSNPPTATYETGFSITAELTIDGITLNMDPNTTIIVNIGAKIRLINGAKITASNTSPWTGIVATGNSTPLPSSPEQFLNFPNPNFFNDNTAWKGTLATNPTVVEIDNSTIEYAKIGVDCKYTAIVRTQNNSYFKDCEIGIKISNYHSPTKPKVSASYIMDTHFYYYDFYSTYFTTYNQKAIFLDNVEGINIGGLDVINFNSSALAVNQRGTGILANSASFSLGHSGNAFYTDPIYGCLDNCFITNTQGNGNTFNYLSQAISFNGSTPDENSVGIRFTTFEDCYNNVYISNTPNSYLSQNTFLTHDDTYLAQFFSTVFANRYDIRTSNGEGMRIIDNTFSDATLNFNSIDMVSSGSGKIMIAKNTFNNMLTPGANGIGIKFNGNFIDTRITCNSFNNLTNAMNLSGSSSLGDQVRNPSTLNGVVARNTFSVGSPNDIVNNGTFFTYFYKNPTFQAPTGSGIGTGFFNDPNGDDVSELCDITCASLSGFTSVGKIKSKTGFLNIYPNPAMNTVTIDNIGNQASGEYSIQLINTIGQLVYSANNINLPKQINIENLPQGIYFIKLEPKNSEMVYTEKLIIE